MIQILAQAMPTAADWSHYGFEGMVVMAIISITKYWIDASTTKQYQQRQMAVTDQIHDMVNSERDRTLMAIAELRRLNQSLVDDLTKTKLALVASKGENTQAAEQAKRDLEAIELNAATIAHMQSRMEHAYTCQNTECPMRSDKPEPPSA